MDIMSYLDTLLLIFDFSNIHKEASGCNFSALFNNTRSCSTSFESVSFVTDCEESHFNEHGSLIFVTNPSLSLATKSVLLKSFLKVLTKLSLINHRFT